MQKKNAAPTLSVPSSLPNLFNKTKQATMPSYFLPYPKNKQHHKPPPLHTANPYPHPHPDPPSNPPSPLSLSSPSSAREPPSSHHHSSPTSSSGSSTIKPREKSTKHVHWRQDYHPSVLKLKIVCGDPEDPSLVVVRFSVRRGHGRVRELGDGSLEGEDEREKGEGRDGRYEAEEDGERHDRDQGGIREERGRKRRREDRS
ncbi:hypothetical protein E4T39_02672 [Aureobasidium subglaciale]|nr:hypothetical protein E4T39_02672 [Aureobasidium subglaciale]